MEKCLSCQLGKGALRRVARFFRHRERARPRQGSCCGEGAGAPVATASHGSHRLGSVRSGYRPAFVQVIPPSQQLLFSGRCTSCFDLGGSGETLPLTIILGGKSRQDVGRGKHRIYQVLIGLIFGSSVVTYCVTSSSFCWALGCERCERRVEYES